MILSPTLLFPMGKTSQFYPNPIWIITKRSVGMDVKRAALIWKVIMNPHDIEMEDISNVFFDTDLGCRR